MADNKPVITPTRTGGDKSKLMLGVFSLILAGAFAGAAGYAYKVEGENKGLKAENAALLATASKPAEVVVAKKDTGAEDVARLCEAFKPVMDQNGKEVPAPEPVEQDDDTFAPRPPAETGERHIFINEDTIDAYQHLCLKSKL